MSVEVKLPYGNLSSMIPHILSPTEAGVPRFDVLLSPLVEPSILRRSINSTILIILSLDILPSNERLYLLPSSSSISIRNFLFPGLIQQELACYVNILTLNSSSVNVDNKQLSSS